VTELDPHAVVAAIPDGGVDEALDVDAMLDGLKAASEQALEVSPAEALALADALIEAATAAGRPAHVALGMMARGDALRVGGDYPESLIWFDRAAAAFEALGDAVGWARTRIGWVVARLHLDALGDALAVADRVRAVLLDHGELARAATLDLNVGAVLYNLGRHDEALAAWDRALATLEALSDTVRAAKVSANRGLVLTELGRFGEALTAHDAARQVFVDHGREQLVLQQDMNSAYVLIGQGHYARALARLLEVPERAAASGSRATAAHAAIDIADCYLHLNCHTEALEQAERASVWFEDCGTPIGSAKADLYSAVAHASLGHGEQALAMLDRAGRAFEAAGLGTLCGLAELERALLHLDAGDPVAAQVEAAGAARRFRSQDLAPRAMQAEIVQAQALVDQGRLDEAAALAQTAVATAGEHEVAELAFAGRHVLATVRRARGDRAGALADCEAAIHGVEQLQGRLTQGLRMRFLDDKRGLYHDAIDLALELDRPELAFAYLERAKSRALADYLTRRPDVRLHSADPAVQAHVDALPPLREAHNWHANRLLGGEMDPAATVDRAAAARELAEIEREIQSHLRAIELAGAETWEPMATAGVDPGLLAPLLGDATAILEYDLRPDRGAVAVLSGAGLRFAPLPAGARAVARRLREWQAHLALAAHRAGDGKTLAQLAPDAAEILQSLYQLLIEPVEAVVADHSHLVIVPYGPTHGVPFHALFDGRRHLIERVEVSASPSAALWRLCAGRPRRPASALILANSDGGRLPHALEEAAAVAGILPGECHVEAGATLAALTSRAPAHGVIHLAAHGEARLDNPAFAHIKLADGRLSAADVFGLDLDGALVTLSACESGRGVVTGGDEVVGLARGFLSAGASTLVQSLWRVEDRATAELMTRFYRGLCAGRPAGEALRKAQLAHLAEGDSHPFFWAPFQLLGQAGPLRFHP
jgi:tetratricopeptide (TPR) repeat protein